MSITRKILQLKEERNAVILAHNYVNGEIQDIADFVGDSLELSLKAKECRAPVIVFCGVRFMAETAKILSPDSVVLHPNPDAGCPMADMTNVSAVAKYRAEYPDTLIVAYVNTTAETKAAVDICCTSGNAERVIRSIPAGKRILFLPDANLGANLIAKLNCPMDLWPGYCPTHHRIWSETVEKARKEHPGSLLLVHPECHPEVVRLADESLSTGGMLKFVRESEHREFIIGTEFGILHRMRKENPGKSFHPLEPKPLCPNMKKITLENVLFSLQDMEPRIRLDSGVIEKARAPIEKMLEIRP